MKKGIIFSLNGETIKKGIKEGKDVFVNFTRMKVKPGMELYLYASGVEEPRKIIAKADIESVHRIRLGEVENTT